MQTGHPGGVATLHANDLLAPPSTASTAGATPSWLNLLIAQFLRYPRAQVFSFDIGYSGWLLAQAARPSSSAPATPHPRLPRAPYYADPDLAQRCKIEPPRLQVVSVNDPKDADVQSEKSKANQARAHVCMRTLLFDIQQLPTYPL